MSPQGDPSGTDPFGTEAVRQQVLAGWAGSVARFREDANAEDDYALGGYHDRLVIELAQNAADAAVRAGVSGVLSLRLHGGVLSAANTGAPLDAAGVQALSTLRASAKREGETAGVVGRFGVGFAAVLALSDEPAIASTSGSVRWSRAETRTLAGALPGLSAELERRHGSVPVLRLPFPDERPVREGYDSEVLLPLRDAAAHDLAVRLLAAVDPTLLLTLPGLHRIEVDLEGVQRTMVAEPDVQAGGDVVLLHDDGALQRWRLQRSSGRLPEGLLANRPAEERERTLWQVLWAVPVDEAGRVGQLPVRVPPAVRAPTVTDERLGLPALLAASLPLDPTRRHIAAGPLRDAVLARAAEALCGVVRSLPADPSVLSLVPVGLALGPVDGVLSELLLTALPETPFLPALDPTVRQRPRDSVVLDGATEALVALLAPVLPGLLPAEWSSRAAAAALEQLEVRRLGLADVAEALAGLDRPAAWWREVYAALAEAVPSGRAREDLGGLPVPLADGRLVTGARGVVLPGDDPLPDGLDLLGVRVVDAAAAHPLLLSLGAVPADPAQLLADDRLRAAVEDSLDADDPYALAGVVLALVATARPAPGTLGWLGRLALEDEAGELVPAEELLLPGGAWSSMAVDDAPFGTVSYGLVERWGAETLVAAGVLDAFAVVDDTDVPVDPDETDHRLDAEDLWLEDVLDLLPEVDLPPTLVELAAVRDLELVRDDAWPEALTLLASPAFRDRVVEPAWALLPDGRRARVPSYTAWWLGRFATLGGQPLGLLRLEAAEELSGLLDPVTLPLDEAFLRAIGVRESLAALLDDARGIGVLLERLAERGAGLPLVTLAAAYSAIARSAAEPPRPARLPALVGSVVGLHDTDDVCVLDAPDLLPLLRSRPLLPVDASTAVDLADVLDVALASELGDFSVTGTVVGEHTWAEMPGVLRALRRAGVADLPKGTVVVHQALSALDVDGEPVPVSWRAVGDTDHVLAGDAEALGRALAWRTNQWPARAAMAEALRAGSDTGAGDLLDTEDFL